MTKLKIPDAAFVIETTPLSIRKWLEKSQIWWLADARPEKGVAAEFGTIDLLRMRLVVVLISFGATVAEAAELSTLVVPAELSDADEDKALAGLFGVYPGESDRLIFTRDGHDWLLNMTNKTDEEVPTTALVIKPEELFTKVIDRARALQERRAWASP